MDIDESVAEKTWRYGILSTFLIAAALELPALLFFLSVLLKNRYINIPTRENARDLLQEDFDLVVDKAAELVAQQGVDAWQEEFQKIVSGYLYAQAVVSRGRTLLPSERLYLQRGPIYQQLAFIDKFADEIRLAEEPKTQDYIANRSRLYSGAGRALWFEINEERYDQGWVIDYFAKDDKGTCEPCHLAVEEGPYLPGEGPFPGAVCLGRGRCRCERMPRSDPAQWALLWATFSTN